LNLARKSALVKSLYRQPGRFNARRWPLLTSLIAVRREVLVQHRLSTRTIWLGSTTGETPNVNELRFR